MISKQQRETQGYFSRHAEEWYALAKDRPPDKFNIVRQRCNYVAEVVGRLESVKQFLDLGCGSGDLAIEMARLGLNCVGVDFAPKMVSIARRRADEMHLSDRCEFVAASVLEFTPDGPPFDLVAALGLIEYFSFEETGHVFDRCREFLAEDGTLVVGSRNRLFNIVSFNDYTRMEIDAGNLDMLMAEALAICAADSTEDCLEAITALDQPQAPLSDYPVTGVPVSVRHQYTPGQLCRLLRDCGFKAVSLSPVHYHVAPPLFLKSRPDLHARMALEMQEQILDCHLALPHASSFLVEARKQ